MHPVQIGRCIASLPRGAFQWVHPPPPYRAVRQGQSGGSVSTTYQGKGRVRREVRHKVVRG